MPAGYDMLVDYHMHTRFSDGHDWPEAYVRRAEELRSGGLVLDEIGFSDHFNPARSDVKWAMHADKLQDYVTNVKDLKECNSAQNVLVRLGLEIDYVPGCTERTFNALGIFEKMLDYSIGSVHYIGDWNLTRREEAEKWKSADRAQTYIKYYGLVREMAESRLFDIVGHLDVVKRDGFYPLGYVQGGLSEDGMAMLTGVRSSARAEDVWDKVEGAMDTIAKSGMCVELNTSGLRHPCGEQYPCRRILDMCHERGIEVTLGSDSHHASHVGYGFDKALLLLKEVGYDTITVFDSRKREQVEI